jgi:hypothetical protein
MSLDRKDYSVRYITNTIENPTMAVAFKAGKEGFYNLVQL